MIGSILGLDEPVRQSEAGECGLACLVMVAQHHGAKLDLAQLRRRFPLSSRGASMRDMVAIADQVGFNTRALRSDVASLSTLALPAILHWDLNHFVVLSKLSTSVRGTTYTVLDPAMGQLRLDEEQLREHFTGTVLELLPTSRFSTAGTTSKLKLTALWTKITGLWPALARILALSIILQIVVLLLPFNLQIAIDTALPAMDVDLLSVVALSFGAILLLNAVVMWTRSMLVLSLSQSLAFQTAVNLFRHTIFLPKSWFEKRHLGDVVSRFGSLQPITDLLSRGLVSALVDGVLAIATFVLMVLYAPYLAGLTLGIVLLYLATKLLFFQSMKVANINVLNAQAMESSTFMESMRGIGAIKAFCQEGNRQRLWQNKRADYVNGTIKLGKLSASFDTITSLIVAFENVVFIYVAVRMIMSGSLTLGMMFALQAYKQSFVGSTTRFIDQALNFRLLDVHLGRLSDMALAEPESGTMALDRRQFSTVQLDNVSYAYGFGLPNVLSNASMSVEPGKTTVLVGPSGSGKTTLLKILGGLLEPSGGTVLIDGVPLQEFGPRTYRDQLGVVSQEDTLFSGTLAENVAFFDHDYDMGWVIECCRRASIHEDILRMPMKYETMVGDMGSTLSGGQRQRVLLARALYKRPRILLLDEGTAHLDMHTEAEVLRSLQEHGGTLVLVAHRLEAIRIADKAIQVVGGKATEIVGQPRLEPAPLLA